jgi:hypothetical protein
MTLRWVRLALSIACTVMVCAHCTTDTTSQAAPVVHAAPMAGVTVADDWPDYATPTAAALYDSLRANNVAWIAITPCGFLDSTFDTDVSWTRWSRRDYAAGIQLAKRHGLKVFVKPYLWSMDFWTKKRWTGDIRHDDSAQRARWFANYTAWLMECARFAEAGKADMFCIGLELPHLSTYTDAWRSVIDSVRSVYHGPLTYASHGLDEAEAIRFWDALDVVGVNIYPTLSREDHPTDDDLRYGWGPVTTRMDRLHRRTSKRIVFTEAGFRSVERAYDTPLEWPEHRPRAVNDEHQRLAYASLAQACYGAPWFGGIFWWKVFTDPSKQNEGRDGFSPQGKPAWRQMGNDMRRLAR